MGINDAIAIYQALTTGRLHKIPDALAIPKPAGQRIQSPLERENFDD